MDAPDTFYVNIGGSDVAYQVFGDSPSDILLCNSLGGHIDVQWQVPQTRQFLTDMTKYRRVIHMDRRGSGASDPLPLNAIPTWETLAEDITAVLDAAGSAQADLLAVNEVGPIAILFAAIHPERVRSLILVNSSARYLRADDYPIGVSASDLDGLIDFLAASWGTEGFAAAVNPLRANDRELMRAFAWRHRAAATPRTAAAQMRHFLRTLDVRPFLPLVQNPTLVLHVRDSPFIPLDHGRFLAEHLPNASLTEMEGGDLDPPYGPDSLSDIAEFLTGERPVHQPDRVLTTVLFTDIVGSTERAASLGDARWRKLLDAHDRAVRERIGQAGGREIKHTGDGFLISFDGPARAIGCARDINEAARGLGIEIRAGLHTGECERRGDDLGGLAVHIAARVNALAGPNQVLVTSTVKDLVVGSGIQFKEEGEHSLKGVPDTWRLFAVSD